jgi:hypothetical protein
MEIRNRVTGIGQLTLGIAFIGFGFVGVLRSLAPPATAALPDRQGTLRAGPRPETAISLERLRARLRSAPDDSELQLRLGHACALRAMVMASQAYFEEFPAATQDGGASPGHFDAWRRAWLRRDPDGDLRRTLHLARRVLAAPAASRAATGCGSLRSRQLRLDALQLVAHVMRQQSREAASIPPLRQIVTLAPGDRLAWTQLGEAYRAVGDVAGFRAARRRAIEGPGRY